jgi:hypothetical protein
MLVGSGSAPCAALNIGRPAAVLAVDASDSTIPRGTKLPKFTIALILLLVSVAVVRSALYPGQTYGVVRDEIDRGPMPVGTVIRASDHVASSDQAERYRLGRMNSIREPAVEANCRLPADADFPRSRLQSRSVSVNTILAANALSGAVCDAETGAPLPGSIVMVGQLRATADESGYYNLDKVTAGELLHAGMPGYAASTISFSGQAVQDFLLHPTETMIQVVDQYSGEPVPDTSVVCGSARLLTDGNGEVVVKRLIKDWVLSIEAAGYERLETLHDGRDALSLALRPNTLHGLVRESSDGSPLPGALVTAISEGELITSSVTGADGRYALTDLPRPLTLIVTATDHDRSAVLVGEVTEQDVYLSQFQVRGIYVPLGILTDQDRVRGLIDLVDRTELNAIVVDIKNDRGWLAYPSAVAEAQRSKAYKSEVMDIGAFLSLCREKDIYLIARLVVFKDSTLATAHPEWAVQTEDDQLWADAEGSSWGDPFRVEVHDYNIAIAKEVAALGFDELQFDYLRVPSDGGTSDARYVQDSTLESRCKAIREFSARLRAELEPYGVLLSADLFGLTVWVSPEEDMGIGQRIIDIAPYMDYISPMLYPATFVSGNLGYEEPLLHPYEVVHRSCVELTKRIESSLSSAPRGAKVRPWLQHYSANGVTYGVEEMRLQKQAAADAQTHGWMFWNAAGRYDEASFDDLNDPR